jgi:RNA polymerase sigma-70 factor (ECF subfamily)
MRELDDWALVNRAQSGNSDAFALLVRRYQGPIVHFCYRMAGSRQDAEDIAQEVFLRLYRHLGRLSPQAKFSTLLFGIARNLTLNHLRDSRRRGRDRTVPLDAQPDAESGYGRPSHEARLREIESQVAAAMAQLTPEHRMILHLREVEGLDYGDIGKILKCRNGTVKSRLARARDHLRRLIVDQGGELL